MILSGREVEMMRNPRLVQAGIGLELFIFIVASAVGNVYPTVLHVVNETVFFIDAAAVFTLQVAGEGLGLPNPFHAAVPLNILNELVDPL